MQKKSKKPLYRKVNTKARGVSHLHGSNYRYDRNTNTKVRMSHGVQRGLDYTPLFKFLLSKVGKPWGEVHSEACERLNDKEPISWMVAQDYDSSEDVVRLGDNAYYSGLYIDEANTLRVRNPEIDEHSLTPSCKCCTHTFNGVRFSTPYPQ
jgi:hypothetical protein